MGSWVTRSRRRIVDAAGSIVDVATGQVLATAEGTYVAADETQKQRLRERYGFRLLRDAGRPAEADTPQHVDTRIDAATTPPDDAMRAR